MSEPRRHSARMGVYRHLTDEQLTQTRDALFAALTDRATKPTAAGSGDRSAQYGQRIQDIERQLVAVNEEIDRRAGRSTRGPIYMV